MAVSNANVTAAKAKVTGAVSRAALGTTLPTDATTALGSTFTGLGYISDAGLTNNEKLNTTVVKAWGGDVVDVIQSDREDTFKFTLIEALNIDVLQTFRKTSDVTGTLSNGITVKASNATPEKYVFVIDEVLKDAVKRIVIPYGAITEIGEVKYNDSEDIGYELTITALADSSGYTHYEYIQTA